MNQVLALLPQANLGVVRKANIQCFQALPQGGLDLLNEDRHVLGHVQHRIIAIAFVVKIGRQILLGVAIAIRTLDPNFLGAQAFPQGAQDADFIVDAIDPVIAVFVLFHHDIV